TNIERVRIDPNGNVGIGTTSPQAKLHVSGSLEYASITSTIGFLQPSSSSFANSRIGDYATTVKSLTNTSILASGRIVGSEINVISDKRIKKSCIINNSHQSLQTIIDIQINDFHYKDEILHGSILHKGVIAQELEAVFP